MLILAIEDQPEFVLMLRSLLRGHTLIAWPNMWQAINECKQQKFDLVLLDLVLVDTLALETLAQVDEIRRYGSNNIVVMTGSYDYDDHCARKGLKVLHKETDFPHKLVALVR